MRFIKTSAVIIILTLFTGIAGAHANVRIDKSENYRLDIYITGRITAEDANTVSRIQQSDLTLRTVSVFLNSIGGEVDAAITIGRIIRGVDGLTFIGWFDPTDPNSPLPEEAKCLSSCALIFIAGVQRENYGTLGLHRPYLGSAPLARQVVEKTVPSMLSEVKNYVGEMGITDAFYQLMVNTEPSAVALFKEDQSKRIVPEYDPVYEETEIAWDARRYGISTFEMRQRNIEADRCGKIRDLRAQHSCEEAIKWGLSETVYNERQVKVNACFNVADQQALSAVPLKLRSENPIIQQRESCARKIMLGR